jgi:hypothetical protein
VVVPTPFGRLGLAIGYDLRFGELFHEMRKQGAELVALPSAFSLATGKAHWHALVQARAIENQLYVLAANQSGVHANGRGTFGHSMVVGPWGNILAEQVGGMGYAIGEVDLLRLQILREDFPVWSHRRLGTHIPLSSDLLASRSSFGLGSSPGVGPLPGVGSSSDLGALPQHSPKPMNPGPGQISPAKKSQSGEGDANE